MSRYVIMVNTAYFAPTQYGGNPETVTEDDGGTAQRTTSTTSYDSSGRALVTTDPLNKQFTAAYNLDEQVESLYDNTDSIHVVTYTYFGDGQTGQGQDWGQVESVTDGLTGTEDTFGYDDTAGDAGIGQVASVTESAGAGPGYVVNYSYTPDGDRGTTTYTTSSGTNEWQYDNYCSVGLPQNGGGASRVPQTMRQIVSGSPTAEEFHYQYDGGGRLMAATFAMTPASGYTPSSGQPWYTPSELPSTRARVVYDNDGGNQLLNLDYYWDNWNSSGSDYNSANIFGNVTHSYSYTYDPNTWLKTQATLNDFNPHNESYSYGQYLDYLAAANYADGLTNPSDSWAYDPAGNRLTDANTGSFTYDNLNRLLTSSAGNYGNDILGDRTGDPLGNQYGWDQENRLTAFTPSGNADWNYTYRADGMRTFKSNGTNSTSYAYDGQTGIEDVDSGGASVVTDYATGGRSVERIARTVNGSTNVEYPVYDGHGNMVSTLSYSGVTCSLSNQRSYDAWGHIRDSDSTGDPKGRYCASLGHKADDESGLTYMRSRFYDPITGRFISEDSTMNGRNWFEYATNDPIGQEDAGGQTPLSAIFAAVQIFWATLRLWVPGCTWLTPEQMKCAYEISENISRCLEYVKDADEQMEEINQLIAQFAGQVGEGAGGGTVDSIDILIVQFQVDEQIQLTLINVQVNVLAEVAEEGDMMDAEL